MKAQPNQKINDLVGFQLQHSRLFGLPESDLPTFVLAFRPAFVNSRTVLNEPSSATRTS
jgi:hypothetical protein